MHPRRFLTLSVLWAFVSFAVPQTSTAEDTATLAANPGQDDLDAAIDAKLTANDLDDFALVLELCKKAMDKGLDEESKKFADELYIGTLVDRAAMLTEAIYDAPTPDPQWPRMRAFAMRDLNEIIERNPDLGQAHLMIARLESLPRGNRERAQESAKKAIELLDDDRLQMAQAHVVLAGLEEDDDAKGALFDKAVELAPRDATIRRSRGLHLLVADKFDQAREDLEIAIEERPGDPGLYEALGMACMMSNELDEAREAFDKAIELEPEAGGLFLQRARLLAVQGDQETALADVDKALDIKPGDENALLLRARIHQQAGNEDRALTDVESVLAADPDNLAALELRGLIAAERSDYEAAIRDFRKLLAKNRDDPVILSQLGMLYLAAKQPREAIKRFTRALELDEQSFPSLRGRSDAEISIGDHKAALTDLEAALALKPEDSSILNNLAWLLATSPDDSIRDGTRAIELATKACEVTEWKQSHIISTLAAGYAETADFDTAKKYSKQAVETDASSDDVRQQLEAELASYEQKKPWRERQEMADVGGESVDEAANEPTQVTEPAEATKPNEARRPFDD